MVGPWTDGLRGTGRTRKRRTKWPPGMNTTDTREIVSQSRRRDVEDDSLELQVLSAQACVASHAPLRIREGMTTHWADFGSVLPCGPSNDTGDI